MLLYANLVNKNEISNSSSYPVVDQRCKVVHHPEETKQQGYKEWKFFLSFLFYCSFMAINISALIPIAEFKAEYTKI